MIEILVQKSEKENFIFIFGSLYFVFFFLQDPPEIVSVQEAPTNLSRSTSTNGTIRRTQNRPRYLGPAPAGGTRSFTDPHYSNNNDNRHLSPSHAHRSNFTPNGPRSFR